MTTCSTTNSCTRNRSPNLEKRNLRQTPKIKAYLAEYRRKHADRIRRVKSDWRRRNHERITRCQLKKLKPSQSLFTVFAALPPGFEADARPTLLTPYEMLALKEEVVR